MFYFPSLDVLFHNSLKKNKLFRFSVKKNKLFHNSLKKSKAFHRFTALAWLLSSPRKIVIDVGQMFFSCLFKQYVWLIRIILVYIVIFFTSLLLFVMRSLVLLALTAVGLEAQVRTSFTEAINLFSITSLTVTLLQVSEPQRHRRHPLRHTPARLIRHTLLITHTVAPAGPTALPVL